jgi:LPXTG-motif cell wall-anchored protein
MMPLFVEVTLMGLAGFAVGLVLAYLVALRRRRNL